MRTIIPGLKSGHRMITPTCRENRTDKGAWITAAVELEALYDKYVRSEGNENVTWHLVLVRDEPKQQ